MSKSPNIADLRRTLREKFPATRHDVDSCSPEEDRPAHQLKDVFSASRLSPGSFTECSGTAAGLALIHAYLLAHPPAVPDSIPALVLIDGNDSFDPASYPPEHCRRLLWARCRKLDESLRACDIVLRDPNLPVVLADFSFTPLNELKHVPLSSWYRLRNLCEESGAALITLTPSAMIPCASRRFQFSGIDSPWLVPRDELFQQAKLTSLRRQSVKA